MAIPFSRSMRALEVDTFNGRRWLVVGLSLLLAWLVWFFGARIGIYESSRRARVESSLAAHPVESPVAGRVTRGHLRLGHPVKAGEVLVELDAASETTMLAEVLSNMRQLGTQLEEVQAEIREAEAMVPEIRETQRLELEQIAAEILEAEAAHTFDEKHLERVTDLHKERLASSEEVDEAQAEVEAGAARIQQLQAAMARRLQGHRVEQREHDNRLRKSRLTAIDIQGRLDALAARAQRHRLQIEERTIRSPVDGRLGEVAKLEPGSVLEAGDAICSVVPEEGTQRIVAGFPAHRILGRLREGQAARVRLDGFPWPEYGFLAARVESIGSGSELEDDGLVRVELSLEPEQPFAESREGRNRVLPTLEHGLPGQVRVLVERMSPAALLLRSLGRAGARSLVPSSEADRGAEILGARS